MKSELNTAVNEIAFNMVRRTRDFGIRMALSASSRQILEMVLKERLVMTGHCLGNRICSVAIEKTMASFLFGVTPTDGST